MSREMSGEGRMGVWLWGREMPKEMVVKQTAEELGEMSGGVQKHANG